MPRGPTLRQADLERAIRALAATGFTVARVEVRPGGEVLIVPAPKAEAAIEGEVVEISALYPTGLTEPTPGVTPSALDLYRARKNGDRAA